ncbi:MAG: methionine synthase, partial [Chloroflexota bacterium]|nr:methionine synthase [Chloroflexota bacterium]
MKRSTNRILTTHTGSLIRPTELLSLADAAEQGDGNRQAYGACLRAAVTEVVRRQAETGIDVVSDGEFGKSSWAAYVLERITGFTEQSGRLKPLLWLGSDRERFRDFFAEEMPSAITGSPAEVCTGPITYVGQAAIQRDIDNFTAALASARVEEAFL